MQSNLFFILKCAGFAYSVLRSWGYRLHYPIAVVVEDVEIVDQIAENVAIFGTKVLSTNMPPKEFSKALKEYHDEVCVLFYTHGRYLPVNMEFAFELCRCGKVNGCEADVPLLLIFSKVIPESCEGFFSLVIEAEQETLYQAAEMEEFFDVLKRYILEKDLVIKHELKKSIPNSYEGRDLRFWSAVITMLCLTFSDGEEDGENERKEQLYDALKKGYERANSYEFNSKIPALFREAFDQAIPSLCQLLQEEKCRELSEQELQQAVLYDALHYYIPAELFIRICEPIKIICSINQLKDVLTRAGILCTQGQGRIYRTIKKKVGAGIPMRYVWLKRECLEGDGVEMSFVDMYRIRRRTGNA